MKELVKVHNKLKEVAENAICDDREIPIFKLFEFHGIARPLNAIRFLCPLYGTMSLAKVVCHHRFP
jgi:hypothetical protein